MSALAGIDIALWDLKARKLNIPIWQLLGVKIHPHLGSYHILDRNLSRLIEREIAPRGLPVLSHVANDAPNVTARDFFTLARRFPETNFIAAHLGVGILGDPNAALNAWA